MAGMNFSFRVVGTQGQDSVDVTTYLSGVDAKDVRSFNSFSSGLQSGVNVNIDPTQLKAFMMTCDTGFNQAVFYGLSGSVTIQLPTSGQLFYWQSGVGFSGNPFQLCSGHITGMSLQQLSGFSSGTCSIMAAHDAAP